MIALRSFKDQLLGAVDKGARTVEDVHVAIVNQPIEILERIAPAAPAVKLVGEIQKMIIRVVYDMIRTVNRAVGDIADQLLASVEKVDRPGQPAGPAAIRSRRSA